MARRKNYYSKRRKRKKGGGGLRVFVLGALVLGGLGWAVHERFSGAAVQVPLNTPSGQAPEVAKAPLSPEQAANTEPAPTRFPVPVEPSALTASASRSVPPTLAAAFSRSREALETLVDLRQIAVEYSAAPESERARVALEEERQRSIILATKGVGGIEGQLRALTRVYVATLDPTARRRLRAELQGVTQRLLFTNKPRDCSLLSTYVVQPGDVLARIARKHNTAYRLIKRINCLQRDRIRVGQRIRIPNQKVSVLILKNDFELILFLGGCFMNAYDIATGKSNEGTPTPEGRFTIGVKMVNPDWDAPDGKRYKFGDERNILGTRWLAFENTPDYQGFGIHGTKFPQSIGTEASMGCVRLRNHDVEVLYDLVPPRSSVRVIR